MIAELMQVQVGLDKAENTCKNDGNKQNQAEDDIYILLFHPNN
jgi:hypothetical protein